MSDNSDNLKKMLAIYQTDDIDWMNFFVTKRNPLTFHHIVPRSIGGKDVISNGAILTRKAHDLLHLLEKICPDAFIDLQNIFIQINMSCAHPDDETIEAIDEILYHVFTQDKYPFFMDIDLTEYIKIYYHPERKKMKIKRK